MKETSITPFLKWPGGKRWFVEKHSHLLPEKFNRYIEPFLGGGAVYFHLQPKEAILSDINEDLIRSYQGIKTNWKYIHRSLQYHQRKHEHAHYYAIRGSSKGTKLAKASRMLYLNRTCFNGIYRVNLNGQFNVPMGTKSAVMLDSDDFEMTSKLLQSATILKRDFEVSIDEAQPGDFIFADPPYTVRHNLNGFVKYNETLFSWDDQERLAQALLRAKNRGVKIVLTNANHSSIKMLYKNSGFTLKTVSRFSSIAASGKSRKQFEELVIISHPNN